MKGLEDTYIFVTMDFAKGQIVRTSGEYTEAAAREELRRHEFSEAEIEAEINNAKAHEI